MYFLLFFFSWLGVAIILESLVGESKYIQNNYKKILFILVTIPIIWISVVKGFTKRYFPLGLAQKILHFFSK
jgi:hypothetical protein